LFGFVDGTGINAKKGVERTKTDQAGEDKYCRKNQQYNTECTGYSVAEIQACHDCRK
jgi:hypothetical protein